MPLPKPLKRGASKRKKRARVREVMHDLKNGPHHKDRTRKQEIAIAMKEAGESRDGGKRKSKRSNKRGGKRKAARRRKRSASRR